MIKKINTNININIVKLIFIKEKNNKIKNTNLFN